MRRALPVVAFSILCNPLFASDAGSQDRRAAIESLKRTFPGVHVREEAARVESIYGVPLASGISAVASAEQVRLHHARVFGAEPDDLVAGSAKRDGRTTQGVMFDARTGQNKFTLVYYTQERDGVPVFGSDLRVLVRNEAGFPAVWARGALFDLGDFSAAGKARASRFDVARTAVQTTYPIVDRFSDERAVIWAGTEASPVAPGMAVTFIAEGGDPAFGEYFKRRFVTDAVTGDILLEEDLIYLEDVAGDVHGHGTPGPKAMDCAVEIPMPFPYATVSISGGASVFADILGNFVLPNAGTTEVTVQSLIRGQYFQVTNSAGTNASLSEVVLPPGPVSFLHNELNTDELLIAQVNGYVNANEVRDFVLGVQPAYPVIGTQTNFPVRVNRNDFYCPGNAWYDGSSINFCRSSIPSYGNTSFASVSQHEYGHHLVDVAGSGQAEYGEGMSDCVAMLIADDPGLGYGFFYNQCDNPLRNADNNCQYSASSCSSCGSAIHTCGQLLSGCVWDFREALGQTDPANALATVADLTVNSILLHVGTSINSQITIDFLTLDDTDGNINNGTPHWSSICAGFNAHGLDCPAISAIDFSYPAGLPAMLPPNQSSTVRVDVSSINANPVPGTGKVYWRSSGASSYSSSPMTEIGPDQYEAPLPATGCGQTRDFYFSVDAEGFGPMFDPPGGAGAPYTRVAATELTTVVSLDFETAAGWTVSSTATDGQWNRGVPAGGGLRGDPPTDYDGSGQCYLTDNVSGNSDVDNGTTTLTSPVYDTTGLDEPVIRYARWFSNTTGDNPQADVFNVEVTTDGVSWEQLEQVGPTGPEVAGGWYLRTFTVSDVATPSSTLQVRFVASDLGGGSVIEAAVDAFEIYDLLCGPTAPLKAAWPDDAVKNRYVSFVGTAAEEVNYQVEMISGPGTPGVVGWVGTPDAGGVARLQTTEPTPRLWPERVIHIADCAIVPGAVYAIRSTSDGVLFSSDLEVETTAVPTDGRLWADVVGAYDGIAQAWFPADGLVNGLDISAVLQAFQQLPTAPSDLWADLNPEVPDGLVNGADILQAVNAFSLQPYPFADPIDCP